MRSPKSKPKTKVMLEDIRRRCRSCFLFLALLVEVLLEVEDAFLPVGVYSMENLLCNIEYVGYKCNRF